MRTSSHNDPLDSTLPEGGGPKDIVIFIMGPTGAGKSSFVNLILNHIGGEDQNVEVGHQLMPCTQVLQPVVVRDQIEDQDAHLLYLNNGYRIVIVDTPGFDDTVALDYEVLKQVSKWYQESCRRKMTLGGIVYLHDISQDRFTGTARRNLSLFANLCGEAALDMVVLLTTKWSRESGRDFDTRERELKETHWKEMLPPNGGASVRRLSGREHDEGHSGWQVIRHILKNLDRRLIQKTLDEVFDQAKQANKKPILETDAERGLRIRLETALMIRKEIAALEAQSTAADRDSIIKEKEQKLHEMHQAIVATWREIENPSRAMRKSKSLANLLDGCPVNQIAPMPKLEQGDIVLLIAGVSGSGRSTFINALLREGGGEEMEIGDSGSLSSCTTEVQCSMIDLSRSSKCRKGYRIFVVDTPGFNDCDPRRTDSAIFQTILRWLQRWIQPNTSCRGGILYLQDISVSPFPALANVNRGALGKNIDSDLFKQLGFVTTKWKYAVNGERTHSIFEQQLAEILSAGSNIYSFKEDRDAWSILEDFLPRLEKGRDVPIGKVLDTVRAASQRPHLSLGIDSFLSRFFGLLERLFV